MLENSLYKLRHQNTFTVGYFGGSITEGAGASSDDKCWAGRITSWLRASYPACEICPVQAAIGGTGSGFGTYRCDVDLASKKPDLVFYEFSVNDGNGDYHELANNCESILRKIWAAVPDADIIMIYTTTKGLYDAVRSGTIYASRAAQAAVSYYYGNILQIDIGMVLADRIVSEGGDWLRYTCDSVHPNDDGYAIYADTIISAMTGAFEAAGEPARSVPVPLPVPMYGEAVSAFRAHMEDCSKAVYDSGWKLIETPLCCRYPHYLEATEPGASLTFTFTGQRLGFYWMMASDSGDIICSVDGGPEVRIRSWDSYCKSFDRGCSAMFPGTFQAGTHTVAIRVSPEKAPGSEGTAIRIGAFLVR